MIWEFITVGFGLFFGFLFLARPKFLDNIKIKETDPNFLVSIIIPARNEAHNLPKLLESIYKLDPIPLEVIVVNDQSNDNTAEIASQHGATVIDVHDKPDDWNGKSFALDQGVKVSQGNYLLFLDADTTVHNDLLLKLLNIYTNSPGLISIQPYHNTQKHYEQLSAQINTLVVGGLSRFGLLDTKENTHGAFGPVQFCSKEQYLLVGGHERVKSEFVEDIPFGKLFSDRKIPVHLYCGKGYCQFRMYPNGLKEMTEGFTKSFAIGASATPKVKLIFSILWIVGAIQTFTFLLTHLSEPIYWLLYLCFAIQFRIIFSWVGKFKAYTWLIYMAPITYFFYIQIKSIIQTKIKKNASWKGRTIGDLQSHD
jgi:4,4'-diaponeurosporenoate glycosyltransferase